MLIVVRRIRAYYHHGRSLVEPFPPFWYNSTMALNIKDAETERLAGEVAQLAGETKTRAVKVALQERRERLARRGPRADPGSRLLGFLADEAWPQVPPALLGSPLTRAEREALLGYGPGGV